MTRSSSSCSRLLGIVSSCCGCCACNFIAVDFWPPATNPIPLFDSYCSFLLLFFCVQILIFFHIWRKLCARAVCVPIGCWPCGIGHLPTDWKPKLFPLFLSIFFIFFFCLLLFIALVCAAVAIGLHWSAAQIHKYIEELHKNGIWKFYNIIFGIICICSKMWNSHEKI